MSGQVGDDIFVQVQGNILFDDDVAEDAVLAFMRAKGTLADRVMARDGRGRRGRRRQAVHL